MSKFDNKSFALLLGISLPIVLLIIISVCIRIYRHYYNNDTGDYSRVNKNESINEEEQNIVLNFDQSDMMDADNEELSFEMASFDTDFDDGDDDLDEVDYSRLSQLENFRHNLICGSDSQNNDDFDVVNVEYESYESFVNPLQDQKNDIEDGRTVHDDDNGNRSHHVNDSVIIINENDDYINESSLEYDKTSTTMNTTATTIEEEDV